MVNKNYIAGRNFEYKVKKYYENQGFTVLRTSGSHGFADLIAVKNFEIFVGKGYFIKTIEFIQCKNRKPTKKEIKELNEFKWLEDKSISKNSTIEVKVVMIYPEKLKEMQNYIFSI